MNNEVKDRKYYMIKGLVNDLKNMKTHAVVFQESLGCDEIIENVSTSNDLLQIYFTDGDIDPEERGYTIYIYNTPFPVDAIEISANGENNGYICYIIEYDDIMNENKLTMTCSENEYFRLEKISDYDYEFKIMPLPLWIAEGYSNPELLLNSFPIIQTEDKVLKNDFGQLAYATDIYGYLNPMAVERVALKRIMTSFGSDLNEHFAKVQLFRAQMDKVDTIAIMTGAIIVMPTTDGNNKKDSLFRIDEFKNNIIICTDILSDNASESGTIQIPIRYLAEYNANIIYPSEAIFSYTDSNDEISIINNGRPEMNDSETIDFLDSVSVVIYAVVLDNNFDYDKINNLVDKINSGDYIVDHESKAVKSINNHCNKLKEAADCIQKIRHELFDGNIKVYHKELQSLMTYNVDNILQSISAIQDTFNRYFSKKENE